ncbi:DUF3999 domain-containing protein [Parachitinimonas caeni]|uniref:DUF3999 domain-containing protein n=1 Tax=Parachitinimonas caeni TaxID=3031301 RepID=A0ABT7DYG8_9NEIS|nr:DUF3999 domain-containing protein [Parachitinimonas caeni]MDK2124869.1 DUF3999 domain-containing protein [Parachitinimonas caeni]
MKYLLGFLLGGWAVAAQSLDSADLYGFRFPVILEPGQSFYSLTLPDSVYRRSVMPDLSDIRIVNKKGEPVPFAWLPIIDRRQAGTVVEALNVFPLPSRPVESAVTPWHVELSADGGIINIMPKTPSDNLPTSPAGYLIDRGKPNPFLAKLNALRITPAANAPDFMQMLTIEASDDLTVWRRAGEAQVARLRADGHQLFVDKAILLDGQARYYRLWWSQPDAAPPIIEVHGESTAMVDAPDVLWTGAKQPTAASASELEFDLGAYYPTEWVQLKFAEPNMIVPATLYVRDSRSSQWHQSGRGVFYRLDGVAGRIESPPLPLADQPPARRLKVVADKQAGILSSAGVSLIVGYKPRQIIFAARGSAPFALVVGRNDAEPANMPLVSLIPGYDPSRPVEAMPVSLGEPVQQPAFSRLDTDGNRGQRKLIALWGGLAFGVLALATMAWRLKGGTTKVEVKNS